MKTMQLEFNFETTEKCDCCLLLLEVGNRLKKGTELEGANVG
jgi:hypothetical protein